MDLGIGASQKVGNDFRTLPFRMIGLVGKAGVFLVAFGWKTYVVKLHFVHAGLGYELRQSDGIILHFGIRGIGPDQLAVFAPGLAGAVRLYGQFRVSGDEVLVA